MMLTDIRKQTIKLTVTGKIVLRRFSHCSLEVKLQLFRSHCYSLYCNLLWSRFTVATMNRLRVGHNNVFKKLPRGTSSSLVFILSQPYILIKMEYPHGRRIVDCLSHRCHQFRRRYINVFVFRYSNMSTHGIMEHCEFSTIYLT